MGEQSCFGGFFGLYKDWRCTHFYACLAKANTQRSSHWIASVLFTHLVAEGVSSWFSSSFNLLTLLQTLQAVWQAGCEHTAQRKSGPEWTVMCWKHRHVFLEESGMGENEIELETWLFQELLIGQTQFVVFILGLKVCKAGKNCQSLRSLQFCPKMRAVRRLRKLIGREGCKTTYFIKILIFMSSSALFSLSGCSSMC